MDRRDFDLAKRILGEVAAAQFRQRQVKGYTATPGNLGVQGADDERLSVVADPDDDSYYAWFEVSGWVLGVESRAGKAAMWKFDAPGPPTGGIGVDEGWRHPTQAPAHPNW